MENTIVSGCQQCTPKPTKLTQLVREVLHSPVENLTAFICILVASGMLVSAVNLKIAQDGGFRYAAMFSSASGESLVLNGVVAQNCADKAGRSARISVNIAKSEVSGSRLVLFLIDAKGKQTNPRPVRLTKPGLVCVNLSRVGNYLLVLYKNIQGLSTEYASLGFASQVGSTGRYTQVYIEQPVQAQSIKTEEVIFVPETTVAVPPPPVVQEVTETPAPTVFGPAPQPETPPISIDSFEFVAGSAVSGETFRLRWQTSGNPESLSIDRGVGNVSGMSSVEIIAPNVEEPTQITYTLTASSTICNANKCIDSKGATMLINPKQ